MNLAARYWRFSRRILRIADAFNHSCGTPVDPGCRDAHRLARENATIQLQDQWSAFCRDLVFGSWRGGVVTLSGVAIQRRSGDVSDDAALRTLRATFIGKNKKSQYWEPKWFVPSQTLDAAKRLSIANFASVSTGVGLTPSPLDELRAVRNYFAHRGRESSAKLAIYLRRHPSDVVAHHFMSQPTLAGVPALVRWAAEIDTMAWAAAQ